ncbi:MAG: copper resistance protein CopC [Steroidobacteraceae bacterium]
MKLPHLIAALLLGGPGLALAHAHLHGSTPANHSTVEHAPASLALQFTTLVRLTALSIRSPGGEPVRLGPLPATPARDFSIPLPVLGPAHYTVSWRAASDDGHIMADTLEFTVR